MKVVGYVRLSRDEDKVNYSSIESQKNLIMQYASEKEIEITQIYVDDNCSGYTFAREGYKQMLSDLENNIVEGVLVKDLSRIGRNNGKVLLFADRLKELGKHLILINEGQNGLDLLNEEYDILGIKTWYNEMYIKDISRKIRSSMSLKQKCGELIMGNFYGYKKLKQNGKYSLIIDEQIRPVIETIFNLYIGGYSMSKICSELDRKAYDTPSAYLRKSNEQRGRVFKNSVNDCWQSYMIKRILSNEVYIGTLVLNKRHSRYIKGKQEKVPINDRYVFENNHEAIISVEQFEAAKKLFDMRKNNSRNSLKHHDYCFSGYVFCADCASQATGRNLTKLPRVNPGYNCALYQKKGNKGCSNHAVTEDIIMFFYRTFLNEVAIEYGEYISTTKKNSMDFSKAEKIGKLSKELDIVCEEYRIVIKNKISELMFEKDPKYKEIIENTYEKIEKEKKHEIINIKELITEMNNDSKDRSDSKNILLTMFNKRHIDNRVLMYMVDRIVINKDRSCEFILNVDIEKLI